MQQFPERTEFNTSAAGRVETMNAFMRGVYKWMTAGLAVTGVVAWLVLNSSIAQQVIYGNSWVFIAMLIAEFGLVVWLSRSIQRMSGAKATGMFMVYSALNGATLSVLFMAFTLPSIATAFFVAAGMFGGMSVYGMTTKRDLTGLGSFMFMGLIGLIIAMVVNLFLQNTMMQLVISCVGVIIFTGLTAFDTQRLKVMGESAPADDTEAVRRASIMGALTLYLDFINLFIMLVQILGDRR